MKLLGLLGYPVEHSASPAMMNAAFREDGEVAIYVPFAVPPQQIQQALNGLQALGAVGVNVTIPHKLAAFEWVMKRTAEAERVGAVNTIRFGAEGAVGHNTDVSGWWRSVRDDIPVGNHLRIVLVGAGGAAMAILAAIAVNRPKADVFVIARRSEAVDLLRARFADLLSIAHISWDNRHDSIAEANVVIQTTPLGMWPHTAESPVADAQVFSPGQVVQDIVYRPRQTRFARQAQERGATVIDGVSMLVYQGVDAYEWWFRRTAPVATMFDAVNRHLAAERHG